MALYLIDKLHLQARKTTAEDVGKLCSGFLNASSAGDRNSGMSFLRQLFFILQAKKTDVNIPSKVIVTMINAITSSDKHSRKECLLCERIIKELLPLDSSFDMDTDKIKEKIPSQLHLQLFQRKDCMSKLFSKAIKWLQAQDLEYEIERKVFTFLVGVSILHSHLLSPEKVKIVNEKLGSWLQDASLYQSPNPYSSNPFRKDHNNLVMEVDGTASTNFFTILSIGQYYTDDQWINIYTFSMLYQWIYHSYQVLMDKDDALSLDGLDDDDDNVGIEAELQLYRSQAQVIGSSSRSGWMSRSMSLGTSASPTYSQSTSPGTEKQKPPVRKVASLGLGASNRRSMTPGSLGQRSNPPSRPSTPSELTKEDSFTGSLSSTSSFGEKQSSSRGTTPVKFERVITPVDILRPPSVADSVESNKELKAIVKGVFEQLVGRTIDYCFRILDQCDRKPKVPSDRDLQNACQLETVRLLDLVCKIDPAQIPKTFRELKRLMKESHGDNNPKLLIAILQYLLNHSSAVAYDPQHELKTLFHRILQKNYSNNNVSFDIVMFILDNLEKLTYSTEILSTYFPNILKIIAWNPHTYLMDFTEIVPAMMSSMTSLEVFHSLIDLPCMTVALEIMEKTKNLDFTALPPSVTEEGPTRAIDAFKNAMFRPMFNFFTRSEGGHGDTIDRLSQFHSSIQDMQEGARVLVCYQTAAVLLREWFNVILEEADEEFIADLVPVLMERSAVIYGIPEYKHDVERLLSDYVVLIMKKFPQIVVEKRAEIAEFLSVTRNINGREAFFLHLVWGVGEYMSTTYNEECTAEVVRHMYEVLEVLTYEVIGVTGSTAPSEAPFTVKVVSVLMSTLAKLSSRCQDLITRAILCLTKVARQHRTELLDKEEQDILLSKAQQLINLLKLPNFASVILNPPSTLETDRVHLDQSSLSTILRTTHRLVAPTV